VLDKSSKTTGDSKSQDTSKSTQNKEVTSTQADGSKASNRPAKVPSNDSTYTIKVTRSDKLDNKLSNKPDDLAEVVNAWTELPSDIRTAILTLVRASTNQQKE